MHLQPQAGGGARDADLAHERPELVQEVLDLRVVRPLEGRLERGEHVDREPARVLEVDGVMGLDADDSAHDYEVLLMRGMATSG